MGGGGGFCAKGKWPPPAATCGHNYIIVVTAETNFIIPNPQTRHLIMSPGQNLIDPSKLVESDRETRYLGEISSKAKPECFECSNVFRVSRMLPASVLLVITRDDL